ncbi:MAG: CBS domain-containing protein [Bacteriovoracaceae bacterium]|jgi:CBS domain-containing protein|nr:CBS domain-containing protein [Bacteriovoracaceae bacterium]
MSFFICVKGKVSPYDFDYLSESLTPRVGQTQIKGAGIVKGSTHKPEGKRYFVIDIKSPDPLTLSPANTIREALKTIEDKTVHHLPIVIDGLLTGMISDRDLIDFSHDELDKEIRLHKVMSKVVLACGENTEIKNAAKVMTYENINALAVIDSEMAFVGLVTSNDILKWVFEEEFLKKAKS